MVGARSFPFRQESSTSWKHHECLVFPWLSLGDAASPAQSLRPRRIKVRSISQKSAQMSLPPGGEKGMFGMHTVPADARSVVITEGELDAMSVRQATGAYAVSLPNGARSLPVEVRCLRCVQSIMVVCVSCS